MPDDLNQFSAFEEMDNGGQAGGPGRRSTYTRVVVRDDGRVLREEAHARPEEESEPDEAPSPEVQRQRRVSQYNSDVYKMDDEKISWIRLRSHININHPRRPNGEKYSVCDEVGWLPCSNCCFKKLPKIIQAKGGAKRADAIYVTELAESLGLGSSLFLFFTKALAWLFFFLTILNIPTMVFFASGTAAEVQDVQSLFAKLSLGNIGQDERSCSTFSYTNRRT